MNSYPPNPTNTACAPCNACPTCGRPYVYSWPTYQNPYPYHSCPPVEVNTCGGAG